MDLSTDEFDLVTCTSTMAYVDPRSGLLDKFVCIPQPDGLICYTNRTDKLDQWKEAELDLERKGTWCREGLIGPPPYLPLNNEYGQEIEVVVFLYRVH